MQSLDTNQCIRTGGGTVRDRKGAFSILGLAILVQILFRFPKRGAGGLTYDVRHRVPFRFSSMHMPPLPKPQSHTRKLDEFQTGSLNSLPLAEPPNYRLLR